MFFKSTSTRLIALVGRQLKPPELSKCQSIVAAFWESQLKSKSLTNRLKRMFRKSKVKLKYKVRYL